MLEDNLIYEGARLVLLVPMNVHCHVIFEHSNVFRISSVAHTQPAVVPEGEIFTIDSILDDEIECDFDNHDALCERFVPERVREHSGTLEFLTCRFFATRADIRKRCEYIGQDAYADEDDGIGPDIGV